MLIIVLCARILISKHLKRHVLRLLLFLLSSFLFMMCTPCSPKNYHLLSTEVTSRPPANYIVVNLMCPCSFSSMLSYTSVAKVLPPEPPSPIGISPIRFPFYRLRFRTFLLFLFYFALLFAHTHAKKTLTTQMHHHLMCCHVHSTSAP